MIEDETCKYTQTKRNRPRWIKVNKSYIIIPVCSVEKGSNYTILGAIWWKTRGLVIGLVRNGFRIERLTA
jgi:hypothetical protein